MAWICPRCEKRIYAPRGETISFALHWKYTKKTGELLVDVKNLKDIKEDAVITHMHCPCEEKPGFKTRIKAMLEMPEQREHPLLF